MRCDKCGSEIVGKPRFCIKCGNKLDYEEIKAKQKEEIKKNKSGAIKTGKNKKLVLIVSILLVVTTASVAVFKDQLLLKGYTSMIKRNINKDLDAALAWADRAHKITNDEIIYKDIYKRQFEEALEIAPEDSIYYLDRLKEMEHSEDYSNQFEEVYIKIAENNIDKDVDKAIEYAVKAMEINKSEKAINILSKASIKKADIVSGHNSEQALDVLKFVLNYENSEEINSKIVEVYLEKAEKFFENNIEESIKIAEKARKYGNDSKIDEFILKANKNMEEEEKQRKLMLSDLQPIKWDYAESSSMLTDEFGTYYDHHIYDGNKNTAWVEGVSGDGIGEWIAVYKHEYVILNKIEIHNGYKKSEDTYLKNNRLKTALVEFSDGTSFYHAFEDNYSKIDIIELPSSVETRYIKLTIVDIYKGHIHQDTCITEIKGF